MSSPTPRDVDRAVAVLKSFSGTWRPSSIQRSNDLTATHRSIPTSNNNGILSSISSIRRGNPRRIAQVGRHPSAKPKCESIPWNTTLIQCKPYPFLTEGFGGSGAAATHPCPRNRSGDISGSDSDPGDSLAPTLAQLRRRHGASHGLPWCTGLPFTPAPASAPSHGILRESLTSVLMSFHYDFI
jgi:hypothetical protein